MHYSVSTVLAFCNRHTCPKKYGRTRQSELWPTMWPMKSKVALCLCPQNLLKISQVLQLFQNSCSLSWHQGWRSGNGGRGQWNETSCSALTRYGIRSLKVKFFEVRIASPPSETENPKTKSRARPRVHGWQKFCDRHRKNWPWQKLLKISVGFRESGNFYLPIISHDTENWNWTVSWPMLGGRTWQAVAPEETWPDTEACGTTGCQQRLQEPGILFFGRCWDHVSFWGRRLRNKSSSKEHILHMLCAVSWMEALFHRTIPIWRQNETNH